MERLVFVAVFLAAVSAAAVDAQRWPPNANVGMGPGGCLKLNNGADKGVFQTDIVESAGADRVSVRFLAENRCQTAIRVAGGIRADGRTIQQRGPIEIHAVRVRRVETVRVNDFCRIFPENERCIEVSWSLEAIGKGSLQSFVVPANGTVAVDGLVMLAAGAVPADVAVVSAAGQAGVYVEGGQDSCISTSTWLSAKPRSARITRTGVAGIGSERGRRARGGSGRRPMRGERPAAGRPAAVAHDRTGAVGIRG